MNDPVWLWYTVAMSLGVIALSWQCYRGVTRLDDQTEEMREMSSDLRWARARLSNYQRYVSEHNLQENYDRWRPTMGMKATPNDVRRIANELEHLKELPPWQDDDPAEPPAVIYVPDEKWKENVEKA